MGWTEWFYAQAGRHPAGPPDDPGNPSIDFRGERRTNATHASTTDPEARLYKKAKGQGAKLSYLGHVLMENRQGLVVDTQGTQATRTAEGVAGLAMVEAIPGRYRIPLGVDKNYDTHDFVRELRELCVTPHVTQPTTGRSSAIDGRTTHHPGYAISQWKVLDRGVERVGESAGSFPLLRPCTTWCAHTPSRQWHESKGREGGTASTSLLVRPVSSAQPTPALAQPTPTSG